MVGFTLHDLQCFDAVIREGGFEKAATTLHRSHPAVFASVARLEEKLGLQLLDRSAYRVRPTDAGRSLHSRAQTLLHELHNLSTYAEQLARGEESELRVVLGDLCPRTQTLSLLSRFFGSCPNTKLHLYYEAVGGPAERLFDDHAEFVIHRVDKSDPRIECISLRQIPFVPVVAAGFLPFRITRSITPDQMRTFTQCIIRDTALHSPQASFFVIEGAHQCVVADQLMKKEMILHGLAWGHLPQFLIEEELRDGRLQSIAGRYFPGGVEELVLARRRDRPHGPVANRLWNFMQENVALLQDA